MLEKVFITYLGGVHVFLSQYDVVLSSLPSPKPSYPDAPSPDPHGYHCVSGPELAKRIGLVFSLDVFETAEIS